MVHLSTQAISKVTGSRLNNSHSALKINKIENEIQMYKKEKRKRKKYLGEGLYLRKICRVQSNVYTLAANVSLHCSTKSPAPLG